MWEFGPQICWVENRRKLVSRKNMNTLEFHSVILLLQTNCSVCGFIILYKNKYILHLTEVFMLYIPKFNILSMDLVHCWNFSWDNPNVSLLLSMIVKREQDKSLYLLPTYWKSVIGWFENMYLSIICIIHVL